MRTQVRDIDFRRTPGVQRNISLKTAWRIMKDERVVTVPVVNRKRLEGVLTVSDITDSFMEEMCIRDRMKQDATILVL